MMKHLNQCEQVSNTINKEINNSFITNAKAELIEYKVLNLMGIDTVKPLRKCLTMNF